MKLRQTDKPVLSKCMPSQYKYPFSLRHSGLEGMGLDLTSSPPPRPRCLLPPCLLRLVALLPPQEDRESQSWGSEKDPAGCGRELGGAAPLCQGFTGHKT